MDWKEAREQLVKEVLALRKMARERFIAGAQGLKTGIVYKFYTAAPGSPDGLARRTGRAARSWATETQSGSDGVSVSIFSRGVPYADFSRAMFIRPKKSQWLVIPAGAGLTAAGVARYPGDANGRGAIAQAEARLTAPPRSNASRLRAALAFGSGSPAKKISFVRKDGNTLLVLAKPGVKGIGLTKTKRLLFILKRVVKRPARTSGLMPYVDEAVIKIQNRMEAAILGYRV
jgi:hypothetical protein